MSTIMIITRDYPPIRNGLADHTALLVEWLGRHFDTITLVCQCDSDNSQSIKHCSLSSRIDAFYYERIRDVFMAVKTAIQYAPPDMVIFQYVPHMWGRAGIAPFISIIPLAIRLRYRIRVMTFLHELCYDWSVNPKRMLLSMIHRAQLLVLGIGSRLLIVTNEHRRHRMAKFWGQKVKRIPAGNVSGRQGKQHLAPVYPSPYITWYGTLSEGQRLEMLVDAFCEAARSVPGLRLLLVGHFDREGDRVQGLIRMCQFAGLASRLEVVGYADEEHLSHILSGSTANVHVNSSGPSGRRTVIAAFLRSGRPLIAVDGYERDPEFVHGENVLLIPDENRMALCAAIESVCGDAGLRKTLADGADRLFHEKYSDDALGGMLVRNVHICMG